MFRGWVVTHRGGVIRERLAARRAFRRRRRTKNPRHRAPCFVNRTRPRGWLAPSLRHRLETTLSWVARLRRVAPITGIRQELVYFDTRALQNPEVSGLEYRQGELAGYEVREYLLEKWQRTCAYCGARDVPLEIEHITAHANGGANRVSNLTLACRACNRRSTSSVRTACFKAFLTAIAAWCNAPTAMAMAFTQP